CIADYAPDTRSLHDALPIWFPSFLYGRGSAGDACAMRAVGRGLSCNRPGPGRWRCMNRSAVSASKDRKVLRRIDFGAARTSVAGVLAALAVFALIGFWGRLYHDFEGLVLGFGLLSLVVTASRLLLVARFDALYASGPARWRRLFGIGLLAHACVWGGLFGTVTVLYGIGF